MPYFVYCNPSAGEFRNRLRGGGGDGSKTARKKSGLETEQDVPEETDEREPLHLQGVLGNLA